MLSALLMKCMGDEHLAAIARAELDPLTSTPLERELLERFERLLDVQNAHQPIADLLGDYEQGTPKTLKAELDLAKQFRAIAQDVGDVFLRLSELTTTANKE